MISAKALLDMNPKPTREEAAYAIRNNICRCTGYVKIIEAFCWRRSCSGGRGAAGPGRTGPSGQPGAPGGRARRRSWAPASIPTTSIWTA